MQLDIRARDFFTKERMTEAGVSKILQGRIIKIFSGKLLFKKATIYDNDSWENLTLEEVFRLNANGLVNHVDIGRKAIAAMNLVFEKEGLQKLEFKNSLR